MASILCKMFGHRPNFGYGRKEGEGYFQITCVTEDGLGVLHASLAARCERCEEKFHVGKTHITRKLMREARWLK